MDPQSNSTSFPWAAESSALSAYWTPRTGYYLTILTVLLSVWLFLRSNPESSKLCVPFYKTSKLKWIFDAESQIVKSYKQVKLTSPCQVSKALMTCLQANLVSRPGLSDQGNRGDSGHYSPKIHC